MGKKAYLCIDGLVAHGWLNAVAPSRLIVLFNFKTLEK